MNLFLGKVRIKRAFIFRAFFECISIVKLTAGPIPGPQTSSGPWSVRNQVALKWSFICINSHSPSLALPPELHLVSGPQQHWILIGAQTLLWINCVCEGSRLCTPYENHDFHGPPWSMEKLSSTKLVPGAKKDGDRCCTGCWGYVHEQPQTGLGTKVLSASISVDPTQLCPHS